MSRCRRAPRARQARAVRAWRCRPASWPDQAQVRRPRGSRRRAPRRQACRPCLARALRRRGRTHLPTSCVVARRWRRRLAHRRARRGRGLETVLPERSEVQTGLAMPGAALQAIALVFDKDGTTACALLGPHGLLWIGWHSHKIANPDLLCEDYARLPRNTLSTIRTEPLLQCTDLAVSPPWSRRPSRSR